MKRTMSLCRKILSVLTMLAIVLTSTMATWVSAADPDPYAGPFPLIGVNSSTPAQNIFKIEGNGRTFVILDKTDKDSGKFFILADEAYGSISFSAKTGGSAMFDTTDPCSIAYKLNNGMLDTGWGLGRGGVGPSYVLPSQFSPYMENHTWNVEAGYNKDVAIPDFNVTCKISLLSKTEFVEYYDRFGILTSVNGTDNNNGWWLRTPWKQSLSTEPQEQMIITSNASTLGQVISTGAVPGWVKGIRPCFYLNKNFFKSVRLDLSTLGSNVKDYLTQEYTQQELSGIYSATELAQIGFGAAAINPTTTVLPNTKIRTPKANIFKINGSSREFVLLDTTNNDAGKFFVLANEAYGNLPFYNTPANTSTNRYDPIDPCSIAYQLNHGALDTSGGGGRNSAFAGYDKTIPSQFAPYMENHAWTIEAGYDKDVQKGAYNAVCKLGLLSKAELMKYYRKFSWYISSVGAWNNSGWWLRTPYENSSVPEPAVYKVTNNQTMTSGVTTIDYSTLGKIGTTGSVAGWTMGIRPCFYLSKDFFKNVKLDLSSMGDNVKAALVQNYSANELSDGPAGYTSTELASIGFLQPNIYVSFKPFTDKNNGNFNGLKGAQSIKSNVNITNTTASPQQATLIIDLYNAKNQLIKLQSKIISAAVGSFDYDVSMDLDQYELGQHVKAMVWDNINNMKPLAPINEVVSDLYDMKILFIGNSYTYYNDLPIIFQKLAKSGGYNVYQDSSTSGGYTLMQHADTNDPVGAVSINKISDPTKHWDYVVLQENSSSPFTDPDTFYEGVRALNSRVVANGAVPAFYQTMAHKLGDTNIDPSFTFEGESAILSSEYTKMANECNGVLMPAGTAWLRLKEQYPDLAADGLWHDDNSHPKYRGSYMNACVFYATLFKKSPVGLDYDHAQMTASEALTVQTIAAQVCGVN